nr:hypothetical protein [Marinitoga lauensis]
MTTTERRCFKMYPKISKVKGKRYLRIMESKRENGKVKQHTVINFGNIDKYSKKDITKLVDSLFKIFEIDEYEKIEDDLMEEIARRNYGAKAIVNKIFERYEMKRYFERLDKEIKYNAEEMLKIMVMNRIVEPKSKLGIFNNLEYFGYNKVEVKKKKTWKKKM